MTKEHKVLAGIAALILRRKVEPAKRVAPRLQAKSARLAAQALAKEHGANGVETKQTLR
jgi:hypothetical protein